jgi:hypothetical protein
MEASGYPVAEVAGMFPLVFGRAGQFFARLAGAEGRVLKATENAPVVTKGGTYLLREAESGSVMRSGHTYNLARRAGEHGRSKATKGLSFEEVHRTDSLPERRGLEQELHETYNPPMNKINGVDPKNPKAGQYRKAAEEYRDRNR